MQLPLQARGPDMQEPTAGLLALPDDILARCLPEDPPDPGESCPRANSNLPESLWVCKKFVQLFARGTRHGSLRLQLPILKRAKRLILRWLTQSFGLHKLELALSQGSTEERLNTLLTPPIEDPTAGLAWLDCITSLRVKTCPWECGDTMFPNSTLTQLVPTSLSIACPALSDLEYHQVNFLPSSDQPPLLLPKLERLELHGCQSLPAIHRLKQQLQALPSLKHFTYLPPIGESHPDDTSNICTAASHVLSNRVTQLCVFAGGSSMSLVPVQQLLASPYPVLQHLALPGATIDDTTMITLLQHTPQLMHIEVDEFQLAQDYSGASCAWQEVYTSCVDLLTLTRLPLDKVIKLGFAPNAMKPVLRLSQTDMSADMQLAVTAHAVTIVQQCGGLRPQGQQKVAVWVDKTLLCSEQVLSAGLPLLTHLHAIALCHTYITIPLSKLLGRLPDLRMLRIGVGSTAQYDVWLDIDCLLPQITQIQFVGCGCVFDPAVVLIEKARRPLLLVFANIKWKNGDEAGLQGTLTHFWPQFVMLQFLHENDLLPL